MQSQGSENAAEFVVDPKYEFSAPHFFDFCTGETDEEAAAAELWFCAAPSHPASPFVGKVKSVRELSMGCTLEEYIEVQKLVVRLSSEFPNNTQDGGTSANVGDTIIPKQISSPKEIISIHDIPVSNKGEPSTPKCQMPSNDESAQCGQNLPLKRNYSELKKQDAGKNTRTLQSKVPTTLKRCLDGFQKMDIAEEKQTSKKQRTEEFSVTTEKRASKKQKLDGGRSYQVPRSAPTLTVPQEFQFYTEKRALIHKETGHCNYGGQESSLPYIPVAEMVQKFQMNLLGDFRTQETSTSKGRNLKLTRPKEPHLGTSLRARPPTIKSSAQLEEEMLANMPKFKARPVNKRILEAPSLPLPHRSTPHLPEFQEFNLRTMERALVHQHAVPSVDTSAPPNAERVISSKGEFHLHTGARVRPPRYKTTQEIEESMMNPQFKARPLDKRIFSSRGDVGVFTVMKRQATIPKEFQFATDQRAHQYEAFLQEHHHRGLHVFSDNCQVVHPRTDNDTMVSRSTPLPTVEKSRKPLSEVQKYSVAAEATTQHRKPQHKNINFSGQADDVISHYQRKSAFYGQPSLDSDAFPVHTRTAKEIIRVLSPSIQSKEQRYSEKRSAFLVHHMR